MEATVESSIFQNNVVTGTYNGSGGGAVAGGNTLTSINCDYIDNVGGHSGGAIFSVNSTTVIIEGGSFMGNSAGMFGGAVSCTPFIFAGGRTNPPTLVIDGAEFSDNFAGSGYTYIDFEHPIDTQDCPLSANLFGQASTYKQADAKKMYDEYYTNITTWSDGPVAKYTSKHVINNYDVGRPHYFHGIVHPGGGTWSDGDTEEYKEFINGMQTWQNSDTIANLLDKYGLSISKPGYIQTGWKHVEKSTYLVDNGTPLFTGYTEDEQILPLDYYIRGPLEIEPIWAEEVNVTYHFDNTKSKDDSGSPYASGSAIEVKGLSDIDGSWTVPTGKEFLGWSENQNVTAGETIYLPGDDITLNGNTNLYARYKDLGYSYTVTFDGNGATSQVAPQEKIVASPDKNVGSLPSAPVRAGYTFAGWNTNMNGNGSNFTAGTEVTGNTDIPLYGPLNAATWALLNLIMCAAAIAFALITAYRRFRGRITNNFRVITSVVASVVGILLFLVTQDMTATMVIVDIWTIVHAVLLALVVFTAVRTDNEEHRNENDLQLQ